MRPVQTDACNAPLDMRKRRFEALVATAIALRCAVERTDETQVDARRKKNFPPAKNFCQKPRRTLR